jgi:catechol 2,3-dioxygenase-like lactoylglutathione lyase family enzyme
LGDPADAIAAMTRRLVGEGAVAVVLTGSHARSAAGPDSDIDLTAIGEGRAEPAMEVLGGELFSIAWRTAEAEREALRDPERAGAAVPAWRNVRLLHDPDRVAAGLQQEARDFRWSEIAAACDAWVAEAVTGYAEEVHKLAGAVRRGDRGSQAIQAGILSIHLGPIMAVAERLEYESENVLWHLLDERLGDPWRSTQAAALGLGGESLDRSVAATLELYRLVAERAEPFLNSRQRSVVERSLRLIVSRQSTPTPMGPPHLGALLSALDDHGVAYVIAGSVAAMAHVAPDVQPADLDVVPAVDPENLGRLAAALDAIGGTAGPTYGEWGTDPSGEQAWVQDGRLRPARALDPADAATFDHSFESPHGRLDVVPAVAGAYEVLRPRAVRIPVAGADRWVAAPIDLLAGMTGPRRAKDGPRVRHLRSIAAAAWAPSGVGFVGLRTDRFDEMVALFRDGIGLQIARETPGATRFRLGVDAELHVYADTDADHAFFTTGPVVGLRVADLEATRARLEASGLELLTEVERTGSAAWCHVRAPDGTVIEIIGPA